MKQVLSIIILVFIIFGCEPKLKPKKPDNLISKSEMTNVLYDMFIVSSAKGISRPKFEEKGIDPEKYILRKYDIDSTQFAESNDYYAHDIEVYKSIIEGVKTRINVKKTELSALEKKEKEEKERIKDSIRNRKVEQRANPNLDENSSLNSGN